MNKKIKLALFGYGNIGKGVVAIARGLPKQLNVELVKVLDLPNKKEELKELYCGNYEDITLDEEISIVFEAMGGDGIAYKAIKSALEHGKSVITSNKETVSKHLDEYISLAKEHNCQFRFEASVGGGIPLINTMLNILSYDEITHIQGILNGTTNYILTKVFDEDKNFQEALKEAQNKGFAEANPDADINGKDLMRKGVILASLAFNKQINYEEVKMFGLEKMNQDIINKIKEMNKQLKYIVDTSIENDRVSLFIMPTLIDRDNPLSSIKQETNAVKLSCKLNDEIMLVGKGAGELPTASAMMQDLIYILNNFGTINRKDAIKTHIEKIKKSNYLVLSKDDEVSIKELCEEELVSYKFIARIL